MNKKGMMKMKGNARKFLASLLALTMLISIAPAAYAADVTETIVTFGSGGEYAGIGTQSLTTIYGLGGKENTDESYVFNVQSSSGRRYVYNVPTSGGFTFEYNLYFDGTVTPLVYSYNKSYIGKSLMTVSNDGTLKYADTNGDLQVYNSFKLQQKRWYRVAVSYDATRYRYDYYVNGTRLTTEGYWTNIPDTLGFGYGNSSTDGFVAFDDFVRYNAIYKEHNANENDVAKFTATEYFKLNDDSDTLTALENMNTVDDFKAKLAEAFTNESTIRLMDAELKSDAQTVEDINIAVVKTTTDAYYYYDVEHYVKTDTEAVELTSNNKQIIVTKDGIVVMSNPYRPGHKISSEKLLSSISSGKGYDLSYVDAKKNSASVDHITDGYILAQSENESLYISIYDKIPGSLATDVKYKTKHGTDAAATIVSETRTVAGVETYVQGFEATSEKGERRLQFNPASYKDGKTNVTFTYVFNMYAKGTADAWVGYDEGIKLLTWDSTGNIYTENNKEAYMTLSRGQWHQVAVTVDKFRNRPIIHIDGQLLPDFEYTTGIHTLHLCISTKGTAGDEVLYSNVTYYEGFYTKDGEFVEQSVPSDALSIDMDTKTIYHNNLDAESLKSAITSITTASSVILYADSSLTEQASEINNDTCAVATSANGMRFEYYTITSMDDAPMPQFNFDFNDDDFKVTTKVIKAEKNIVLYLASYSSDNCLLNVAVKELTANDLCKEITKTCAYGDSSVSKVKAFLWYDGLVPIACDEADVPTSAEN